MSIVYKTHHLIVVVLAVPSVIMDNTRDMPFSSLDRPL